MPIGPANEGLSLSLSLSLPISRRQTFSGLDAGTHESRYAPVAAIVTTCESLYL
jgi:hypothetical protein